MISVELEKLRAVFGYAADAWKTASELYIDALTGLPHDLLTEAVSQCIRMAGPDDRFPRPGQIRALVSERLEIRKEQARRDRPRNDGEAWPAWLSDLWGPEPGGPIKRNQALAEVTYNRSRPTWAPGFTDRYEEPWFRRLNYETQQRYMAQDQARLEMHNRVMDGKATKEQFAALCVQQAQENFGGRSKVKREARMTPAEIEACRDIAAAADAEAAKKRRPLPRHEDPEQLRLDWIKLQQGLE